MFGAFSGSELLMMLAYFLMLALAVLAVGRFMRWVLVPRGRSSALAELSERVRRLEESVADMTRDGEQLAESQRFTTELMATRAQLDEARRAAR